METVSETGDALRTKILRRLSLRRQPLRSPRRARQRCDPARARCRHIDCALECYAAAAAAVQQQLYQPILSTIILNAAMQFRLLNAAPYRPVL